MDLEEWRSVRATTGTIGQEPDVQSGSGYFPRIRYLYYRLDYRLRGADYKDAPFYPVATPQEVAKHPEIDWANMEPQPRALDSQVQAARKASHDEHTECECNWRLKPGDDGWETELERRKARFPGGRWKGANAMSLGDKNAPQLRWKSSKLR